MPPEFAQIHTCILSDPNINDLSPEAGWNWVRMVVLAKRNRDRGRIGGIQETAYVLRTSVASIEATVRELDGRIMQAGDQLTLRDYRDWQTLTNRERQADWRDAHPNEPEPDVTPRNEPLQPVTPRNSANDKGNRKGREVTTKQPSASDAAPDAWEELAQAASACYSGKATRRKDGARASWVGNIIRVAGEQAHDDPARALSLWRSFWRSLDPDFLPSPYNAADKFGAWAAARRGNGHAGAWRIKEEVDA